MQNLADTDKELDIWRHGKCYAFAVAIHRLADLPLVTLYSKRSPKSGWHPAHIAVQRADGILIDAGGLITREEIFEEFLGLREGDNDRAHAREIGHFVQFDDTVALKARFIEDEGADFIEKHAWPFIEELQEAAREFIARRLDLEELLSEPCRTEPEACAGPDM